jgi:hypothetical protein
MIGTFSIPQHGFSSMRRHLLPRGTRNEQAGFVFAHATRETLSISFDFIEWLPLGARHFNHQSPNHLELRDETRAEVIKRAHDVGCSLIEFHSHPGHWPAQFSGSDFAGFREFVPHVLWRLKGKPYGAVVVAPSGVDALAWTSPSEILRVQSIMLGFDRLTPTGLSMNAVEKGIAWNISTEM